MAVLTVKLFCLRPERLLCSDAGLSRGSGTLPYSPLLATFRSNGLHNLWFLEQPHIREYAFAHKSSAFRIDYISGNEEMATIHFIC